MHRIVATVVALSLALLPLSAGAHGGGLDAYGCHTNHSTGSYHCHRGASTSGESSSSERGETEVRPAVIVGGVAVVVVVVVVAVVASRRSRGSTTTATVTPTGNGVRVSW